MTSEDREGATKATTSGDIGSWNRRPVAYRRSEARAARLQTLL